MRGAELGRLATVQPDGTPQASPVGFTFNEELGTIDIAGYRITAKLQAQPIFSQIEQRVLDIAWRMARAWTGNQGFLTQEFAYHGITEAISACGCRIFFTNF